MHSKLSRRESLKLLAASGIASLLTPTTEAATEGNDRSWSNTNDRVWLGGDYWANPMENWKIKMVLLSASLMLKIEVFIT